MVSFSATLVNGAPIILDTILRDNILQMYYAVPHSSIGPLFYQAIGFILNLN